MIDFDYKHNRGDYYEKNLNIFNDGYTRIG